jgi:hypothetical protein
MQALFQQQDRDRNGRLDANEISAALAGGGFRMGPMATQCTHASLSSLRWLSVPHEPTQQTLTLVAMAWRDHSPLQEVQQERLRHLEYAPASSARLTRAFVACCAARPASWCVVYI